MQVLSPSVPSSALLVPKQLSFSANKGAQQLSISWVGGTATTFDMLILRTELNETVFYVGALFLLLVHHLMISRCLLSCSSMSHDGDKVPHQHLLLWGNFLYWYTDINAVSAFRMCWYWLTSFQKGTSMETSISCWIEFYSMTQQFI